ncbi:RGD1562683 (predicted) [Rattus norvegicus]|uniref:RGD1562683 (Predicted) n=2 Tax=Rattus norvegicus TaxID=10116 RepID=A6JLL2_RAT|nr:uncharacterized protein LOC360700 [Rattus norvegicus]EDM10777.1 RGD1562683 (predicted) [Rattus norvegicus]|eukprot:NP_001101784.1 uncharacterized protein LOC360700 [Rattus norvegicus]
MVGERREDTEKAATLSKPLMKADWSHRLELPADCVLSEARGPETSISAMERCLCFPSLWLKFEREACAELSGRLALLLLWAQSLTPAWDSGHIHRHFKLRT